jgi:prepilin-type N-terminal cleavage/methylation domain-containing protein
MSFSPLRTRLPRTGFTLVELLIVMAIIAVLISITIPAVMKVREAANRTTCMNNLKQLGTACWGYNQQFGYFPTAGVNDFAAPTFSTTGAPLSGWQQDAGWAYQILPYLNEENVWTGGAAAAPATNMANSLRTTVRFYFCPSRRTPSTMQYKNALFPAEAQYSAVRNNAFTVFPSDYAACNGSNLPANVGNGIVLTQANGRSVVQVTDITDGVNHTILLGEKAGNAHIGAILNEDDMGYASAYSAANLNTLRFTNPTLLPLQDVNVAGPTGGAFGSAHFGTWNACMADGSVVSISYTIDPSIFAALGTIRGQELIDDSLLLD